MREAFESWRLLFGWFFAVSGNLRFLDHFCVLHSNLFTAIPLSILTFSMREH